MAIRIKPILLLVLLLVLGVLLWQRYSMQPINTYSPHFGVADKFYKIYTGHEIPKSKWFAKEQAMYQEGFKGKQFDLLVVPAQVQHNAIDPIGRSLMSAYLVDAISKRSSTSVPNSYHVARALGAYKRQYDPDDVYKLANELGVSAVAWVYVGHQSDMQMNVKLFVQMRNSGRKIDAKTKRKEHNWDGIEFSDQHLPSLAFVDRIDDILAQLPLTSLRANSMTSFVEYKGVLPASPIVLVKDKTHSALEAAEYYQWFGALTPKTAERQRQVYFEKSLVVLRGISDDCAKCKILKARAYSYLHRRPAGIAVLGNLDTSEAKSVLHLLNGNMNKLSEFVEQSGPSLARNIAIVGLTDLELEYGKALNNRWEVLGGEHQKWSFLFERRLNENDAWFSQANIDMAPILDAGFGLKIAKENDGVFEWLFLLSSIIPGNFIDDLYDLIDYLDQRRAAHFNLSIHQDFREMYKNRLDQLCCKSEKFAITELDYLSLLDSIFVDNAIHLPDLRVQVHGLYQKGLEEIELVQDMYGGHPRIEFLRAEAFRQLSKVEQSKEGDSFQENSVSAFWDTMYLYQRQEQDVQTAASSLWYFNEKAAYELVAYDFPRRHYWWTNSLHTDRNYEKDNPYYNKFIKLYEVNLDYTQTNSDALKRVYNAYQHETEGEAGKARAINVLGGNKNRFEGRAERTQFMAELALTDLQVDEAKELYKKSITNNPEIWDSYISLAKMYIRDGEYSEALSLALSHPLLDNRKNIALGSSYNLLVLGNQFYWRGKADEAKQLYTLSVAGSTGSSSEISAQIGLALLDGDIEKAATYAEQDIDRYNSYVGYGEYMLAQHALALHDQAEKYLRKSLKQSSDMHPWHGVFVGHQKQGFTRDQLSTWLQEERSEQNNKYNLAKYTVMALLTDRAVDSGADKLVESIEGKTSIFVDIEENIFERAQDDSHYAVGPGVYNNNNKTKLSKDAETFSDLVLFTRGYTQILQKNYSEAFRAFEQFAQTYYLLGGQTQHALPYLAWSARKSHQETTLEVFLDSYKNRIWSSEYYLARAVLAASKENVENSISLIRKSVDVEWLFDYYSPFDPWYQLVEICEWLYEDIGDERYKALALEYAKKFQIIRPMYAWSYAVEAKLTDSPEDQIRALALAQNLDPRSRRISGFSEQARNEAKAWLAENDAFLK